MNVPVNIGPGSLIFSGNNNNNGVAPSTITGTAQLALAANANSQPLGAGTIPLGSGATLQLTPFVAGGLSSTGYSAGAGMSAKYYQTGQANWSNAPNWGIAPNATLVGMQPNDSLMRQAPAGVNIASTQAVAPAGSRAHGSAPLRSRSWTTAACPR